MLLSESGLYLNSGKRLLLSFIKPPSDISHLSTSHTNTNWQYWDGKILCKSLCKKNTNTVFVYKKVSFLCHTIHKLVQFDLYLVLKFQNYCVGGGSGGVGHKFSLCRSPDLNQLSGKVCHKITQFNVIPVFPQLKERHLRRRL